MSSLGVIPGAALAYQLHERGNIMTPNKENIRKWVDALRSGDYKQTTDLLARVIDGEVVGHCCLGVACEVAGVKKRQHARKVDYDGYDLCLPQSVQEWLGIDAEEPSVGPDLTGLTKLNDDKGATFAEIADLIEAEWL